MTDLTHAPVAFLDLAAERRALGPALSEAVERVLESGRFVLGPEVERFEADFAHFQGARHGVGVASGTDALILALKACGVGPGDGVVTSAFTFFASAAAIAWVGALPILVDVEEDSGLMDTRAVEQALEAAKVPVRCLMPVHLYGRMADMETLTAIARAADVRVIEDAAQAHGALRSGVRAGELGDMACFSFYPTKNLGCAGEGGMVVTRDDELNGNLRRLRDHGSVKKYEHEEIGTNSRLAALQAAVLNVKLPHLRAWNDARRRSAAIYDRAFLGHDGLRPLLDPPGCESVYHQYVVRVGQGRRDAVLAGLNERGIGAAVHYPKPVHRQPAGRDWVAEGVRLPVSEALAEEVLCLPIHPFLETEEVERVAGAVLELVGLGGW